MIFFCTIKIFTGYLKSTSPLYDLFTSSDILPQSLWSFCTGTAKYIILDYNIRLRCLCSLHKCTDGLITFLSVIYLYFCCVILFPLWCNSFKPFCVEGCNVEKCICGHYIDHSSLEIQYIYFKSHYIFMKSSMTMCITCLRVEMSKGGPKFGPQCWNGGVKIIFQLKSLIKTHGEIFHHPHWNASGVFSYRIPQGRGSPVGAVLYRRWPAYADKWKCGLL